jgi:hypothetical protein
MLDAAFSGDGLQVHSFSDGSRTRAWAVSPSAYFQLIDGSPVDLPAIAEGGRVSRWRAIGALRREQEAGGNRIEGVPCLVVESESAERPVAYYPADVALLKTSPNGRTWAAASGVHMHLFTLEGPRELRAVEEMGRPCGICGVRCGMPLAFDEQFIGAGCFSRLIESSAIPAGEGPAPASCDGCRLPIEGAAVRMPFGLLCADCVRCAAIDLAERLEPLTWGAETIIAALADGTYVDRIAVLRRFPPILEAIERDRPDLVSALLNGLLGALRDERLPLNDSIRSAVLMAGLAVDPRIVRPLLESGVARYSFNELCLLAWLRPEDERVRRVVEAALQEGDAGRRKELVWAFLPTNLRGRPPGSRPSRRTNRSRCAGSRHSCCGSGS